MPTNETSLADILGAATDAYAPFHDAFHGWARNFDRQHSALDDPVRAALSATGLGEASVLAQAIAQRWKQNAAPKPDPSSIDLPVDMSQFSPGFADKQQRAAASGMPDWLLQALRQLYLFRQQRARELSGVGPDRGMAATPLDALLTGGHDAPLLPAAPATPTDILSNAAGR